MEKRHDSHSVLHQMLEKKKIHLDIDPLAVEKIKEMGVSQEFGAREVDRIIRNEIKPLFVDEILFGRLKKGGSMRLTIEDAAFAISMEEE